MREERSIGALLAVFVVLGLLYGAYSEPWFHYDHTSGRTTAPDGPYEDPMYERDEWTLTATESEGNIEPGDPALVERFHEYLQYAMYTALGVLAIAFLAEVPFIARIVTRRVSLVFISIGLLATIVMSTLAWLWIPETMAAHGVTEHYTYYLEEPVGYTQSTLDLGAYLYGSSILAFIGLALFKYQAGTADPKVVEELARSRAHRPVDQV